MLRFLATCVVALHLLCCSTGCVTTFVQSQVIRGNRSAPRVYGGVRATALLFAELRNPSNPMAAGYLRLFAPIAVLDLPLSLAADTLILPITICQAIFLPGPERDEPSTAADPPVPSNATRPNNRLVP